MFRAQGMIRKAAKEANGRLFYQAIRAKAATVATNEKPSKTKPIEDESKYSLLFLAAQEPAEGHFPNKEYGSSTNL